MPLYRYDSFSRSGKRITGNIDSISMQTAKQILQGQGLMPVKIEEIKREGQGFNIFGLFESRVDLRTKIIFTKQLAVLLKSGVPLLQAFELLIEQFEKRFKSILIRIKDGIKGGESLASQLSKFPKVFPTVYVQLVKAGEASGKLHLILEGLTEYLEKEETTRKKIKKAMAYPIFMLIFSFVVVASLLVFLVPRITELFTKMKKDLPGPTLFLKDLSDFLIDNFTILSIVIFVSLILFAYWRTTASGKYKLDKLFLKIPLISYFSRTKAVVQFSKTLGMLLESGVNLSEALDIVYNIVDNQVLVKKLQEAKDKIIKEGKISKYLKETGIFPNIASYMISTGEQSGKLAEMLLTVGNDYEEELNEITDALVSKIGPVMTIITGLVIAFIVIAVFLPILDMGDISGF